MIEHLGEPITLGVLAAAARISKFHFTRVFRQKTGFTPMAYVRTLRISKAQELLRQGHLNVSEIGRAVGYPVVQRFSEAFKKVTGWAPRQYVALSNVAAAGSWTGRTRNSGGGNATGLPPSK